MCCDETSSAPAPFQVDAVTFDGENFQAEVSGFEGQYDWYGIVFVVTLDNGKVFESISAKYREGKSYQSSEKSIHESRLAFGPNKVSSVSARPEFALSVDGSVWGNEKALSTCVLMMKRYEREEGKQ